MESSNTTSEERTNMIMISIERNREGDQILQEFLKIKKVLANVQDEEVVFELLSQLKRMTITKEILEVTLIAKIVNGLKKVHKSKSILQLRRSLLKSWKNVVDEWLDSRAATVGESSKSEAGSSVITQMGSTKDPQPSTSKSICAESSFRESDANTGKKRQQLNSKPPSRLQIQIEGLFKSKSKSFMKNESEPILGFVRPPVQRFPPIKPSTSKQAKPPFKGSNAGIRRQILKPRVARPPSRLQNESGSKLGFVRSSPPLQDLPLSVQTLPRIKKIEEISVREMLELAKRKYPDRFPQAQNAKKQWTDW